MNGSIKAARGVVVTPQGKILVVEADAGRVTAVWDSDNDGVADQKRRGSCKVASLAKKSCH